MVLGCTLAEVLERRECPGAGLNLVEEDERLAGGDGLAGEEPDVTDDSLGIEIPFEQVTESRVLLEVEINGAAVFLLSELLETV